MMVDIEVAFRIGIYFTLIILLIALIVLVIRLIKMLKKVDTILDEVDEDIEKIRGVFDIIDKTTDFAVGISDRIVSKVSNGIQRVFKRRRGNDLDE